MLLSEYVRQRRKELGLTQEQLANRAGISIDTVQRFEADRPYNPHGKTFLHLCTALKVESDFVLFECEWPLEQMR